MASASIESTVTLPVAKATIADASRDDLELNDVVVVNSVNAGTAYVWSLAYTPEGSAAAFTGSDFDRSPGTFTIDQEGPYLVRLVLTVPTVTVGANTITVGSTLTINGVVLTAASGPRAPGADNFDGTLGTAALIAADIVAALNDGANSFSAIVAPTVAGGSAVLNLCPVVSGATITAVSSTPYMVVNVGATSEQFVRLRALTAVGSLKLVSAGERVDTVPVPVDITFTGWADEQNFNLLTLLGLITSSSGIAVEDEGGVVEAQTLTMDFVGTAVAATSPSANNVTVTINHLITAVAQETFAAGAFTAAVPSEVTLANTWDSNTVVEGMLLLFRNGKADMTRVAGVPATADEYRITGGTTLQIGEDATLTSNVYLIAYPHL